MAPDDVIEYRSSSRASICSRVDAGATFQTKPSPIAVVASVHSGCAVASRRPLGLWLERFPRRRFWWLGNLENLGTELFEALGLRTPGERLTVDVGLAGE